MQILDFKTIKGLDIAPETCYAWVEETLREKAAATLPPKISLHLENDSFFNVMPGLLPQSNTAGVKVITRQLDRAPALDSDILVYDYQTKLPLALMDGNWITAMRTGAVAAHSVMTLASDDFFEIGVMGLGNTGRAAMEVLLSVAGQRALKIKVLKYKNQHTAYIEKFRRLAAEKQQDVEFVEVGSIEEIIKDSDVIISAVTYQDDDFADPNLYKPGCLVVAIHLRGFMNCDLKFDRIFCDDIPHVEDFKYYSQWPNVTEIADVVGGISPGRLSDQERIIVYNVGLALHDINFARRILEISGDAGHHISLQPPLARIWL